MKAYTDLEQSKKLAEILPVEGADIWWVERYVGQVMANGQYVVEEKPVYYLSLSKPSDNNYSQDTIKDIPSWSLASLLNYLREIDFFPNIEADEFSVTMNVCYYDKNEGKVLTPVHEIKVEAESFVDACYELILKLNEIKMI